MKDFLKKRDELYRRMEKSCKKHNIPVYGSKDVSEMTYEEKIQYAERLRQSNIESGNYFLSYYPSSSATASIRKDLQFDKVAYEQMTPEEILLSEQREDFVRGVELSNFLIDMRISQLEAKRPELNPLIARAVA